MNDVQNPLDGQPGEEGSQEETLRQELERVRAEMAQIQASNKDMSVVLSQLQRTNEHLEQMMVGREEPDYGVPESFEDLQRHTERQIEKAMETRLKPIVNNMQRQTYETQLSIARKEFDDFDEVARYASEFIERNPRYRNLLENSDNLPATMYSIGQLHPKYREELISKARQETLKGIQEPKGTIAGKPGANSSPSEIETLSKMPRSEFLKKYGRR